jgi:hypothetical protein
MRTEGCPVRLADLVNDDAVCLLRNAASAALKDKNECARYFGLSPYSERSAEGQLGYFVGIGRLPQAPARVLYVEPRRFDGNGTEFRIDYLALYAACAADPEVSSHLDQCLTVYPDEAPIEAPEGADWSPLIALAYLRVLHDLVQRHLRRGFISREEDLCGRIRGQVAFGRYAARSLARGHPEIVPCRFQALEQDTLENRILRTALVGARRLLDGAAGQGLSSPESAWRVWSRQADAALAGAAIARITPRDFRTARKAGAYRHYARPLALARAVLTHTGFDPNQPVPQAVARLVPFRLATPELFERYVEVCLRKLTGWEVWAGYQDKNLGEYFKIRPDFLVWQGDHRAIVDAKYKDFSKQGPRGADEDNSLRWDVYQTLAYSRHRAVLEKFANSPGAKPAIVLCYPERESTDALSEASSALQAALTGENHAVHRRICDFDLPLVLVGLPVPTVPGNGTAPEA